MPHPSKTFFAGQEEVFARLASFFVNCLFFSIFIVAKGFITIQWKEMLIVLGVFWFLYELFAISLFQMFVFFSNNHIKQEPIQQVFTPNPTEIREDETNQ